MRCAILHSGSACFCRVVIFTVALSIALVSSSLAFGAKPFKSRVTGEWDNVFAALPPELGGDGQASFTASSQTTHLGRAAQQGTLFLDFPIAPNQFPGTGSVTITGANGDSVTFDYIGLLNAATGEGVGSFTFTSGTGRFANVTGEGTFYALIDLTAPTNQAMTVVLDGRINY